MQRNFIGMLLLAVASACRGAWYTPTSALLDAATGKSTWEGPDDSENFGSPTGTHSAHSHFSYFSNWSMSNIDCDATASASLGDGTISLYVSNSTDGYGYAYTQGAASATVDFTLPSGQWLILDDSDSYAASDQVACTLTGPGGWTWSGPYGSSAFVPAGNYIFSINAAVARTAGIDSPSSDSASLQVLPEPAEIILLAALPFFLKRRK